MSPPVRWGLSIVDWRYHAVQDHGCHPGGALVAECGHELLRVTTLLDEIDSRPCDACARLQLDSAGGQENTD
ncbi:MAG TPA: hypothetical protein VJT72_05880 [Pseudonocardiaceae bacterium]|nr:hypothetical protein [Pseudonocardiaceae bacterium]